MAPSTAISSLTDELVSSFISNSTPASKVRRLKDTFNRQLRHHNYARTNQFEVAARLDGLQEKFLVLNNDDLAGALRARLGELKNASRSSEKWLPDVLHLLLQLSVSPSRSVDEDDLRGDKTFVEVVPLLRWADIEGGDPIDRESQIWKNPDFSDLSSDEDALVASSEPSSSGAPQTNQHAHDILGESTYLVDRDLASKDHDHLARNQIWKLNSGAEIAITELQAVREALFMLQGLPTMLFWRVGDSMEIDQRYRLSHVSFHLLRDILESFANIGLRIDLVRTWLKQPQTVAFMQSLHAGIEEKILCFDSCVSQMQSRLLAPHQSTVISLAKALDEVMEHSKLVIQVASFLEQVTGAAADSIGCLDLLYSTVCSCQASSAEDLFEPLSRLFLKSFEMYLESTLRWIDFGEISSSQSLTFIRKTTQESSPLSGLWNDWYQLSYHPSLSQTPRFMQKFMHEIFIIGKTKVFLRHLPNFAQDRDMKSPAPIMEEIRSAQLSSLIPFSVSFETAITRSIGFLHQSSSGQLREKLAHECGLWRTLSDLHSIYLGGAGWILDSIDTRIFDRIDRGNQAWDDRYLLTELWRNSLQGTGRIDTERITVQTGRSSSRDLQSQRRTVRMLESIALTYTLPWPVANIVSDSALQIYRRVSTFLFQIRRARYVLERRCRVEIMSERLGLSAGERRLAQKVHWQLLIFVNHLYDHLTLNTIEHTAGELRQALTTAVDVDSMIQAHQGYVSRLDDMCLVSRRVSTIRRALTLVLDLCIRFSDTVTSPLSRRSSVDAQSFKSAASRLRDRYRRRGADDSSTDEDSSESHGEGFSTFVTFDESSYEGELRHIKLEFERQKAFITSGLKSLGRVEVQSTGLDVLAERLG